MIFNSLLIISVLLILEINQSTCDRNLNHHNLALQRRSFLQFLDEDKLQSYLSSFGERVMESKQHMVFKRASGRTRKLKKVPISTSSTTSTTTHAPQMIQNNEKGKNFTIMPRHMVKFGLEDAKYSEEYEKLKKSRKLRVKRSASKNKNDSFVEPKELLRFLYTDAVIKQFPEDSEQKEGKKTTKREVNASSSDSMPSDTRKIKITHPLSSTRKSRFVTFDDLPNKMKKIIESALKNAQVNPKISDGDILKFYYGDKVIRVPVSISKSLLYKPKESYENYSFKPSLKLHETKDEYITEAPQYKTSYYKLKPTFKIPEKAESYLNFEAPKEKYMIKHEEEPKKSFYFYTSDDENKKAGPILFETVSSSVPTSSESQKENYEKYFRDTIPITEDFNEKISYSPLHTRVEENSKPSLPAPTSYVEFSDNSADLHEEEKNYEFGYHVADYKSGNNFGHTQVKNKKEIKGEYSILMADGRIQITKYIADDSGFHADITYQNVH